jgi:hypothetical protein
MDFVDTEYARTDPIRLDGTLIRGCSRQEVERRIRRVVRSVRFDYLEEAGAFRILGPDTSYHAADPHLVPTLAEEWDGLAPGGIVSYRTEARRVDLCFEDSWSGWFIARCLQTSGQCEDLILIHLDDHTDMMPTLLRRSGEGLADVATDRPFRAAFPSDWEASIRTGAVGIGSFITPIYYSGHKVHVRHLNHFANSTYRLFNVTPLSNTYALIPRIEFAGIRKRNDGWEHSAGTYLGGADAAGVLRAIPDGRVVVHIDLDYFINDFNGNPGTPCTLPDRRKNERARHLMDRFFEVVKPTAARVERWIVATSPGFCSALHWRWLLEEIEDRIDAIS